MEDAIVGHTLDEQNVDVVPDNLDPLQDMDPQNDAEPEEEEESEEEEEPQEGLDPQQEFEPQEDSETEQTLEIQQRSEPEENLEPTKKGDAEERLKTGSVEQRWPGWPGDSVFRILVPAQKVGGIIGRKGEFIKKITEETRARIKILDGPPGTAQRAVIISAKEEPESPLPPAIDGLLRVHKKVVDGDGDSAATQPGGKVSTRLLVPASQTGNVIGKHGATVKSIQEESGCIVRVLSQEDVPVFALQDDRVIEVVGEVAAVYKAVELIASHLRKFLVDHSIIPLFEAQMRANPPPPPMDHMPPHQPWGPPQGFRPNAGGFPGGPPNHQYMPPPRQHESYYPPPEMAPPMDQPPPYSQHQMSYPHHPPPSYGREAPVGAHAPLNTQAAPAIVKQITQQMQIPLSFADTVIGEGGSTISYIRRSSGATVTVQETRGVPGEMTVEISGTASQVQTAQQLVQNYIAEAAAPSQAQQAAAAAAAVAPVDHQGYASYGMHGGAANPGHSAGGGGGYDSVYGSNYGY